MRVEKFDLWRVYKDEYVAPRQPTLIRSLKARFLTTDGQGDPRDPLFISRVRALYAVALRIRKAKRAEGHDFDVFRVETIWSGDGETDLVAAPKSSLRWKLLIRLPHFVEESDRLVTILDMIEHNKDPALLNQVRIEAIREGLCVQQVHVGPPDGIPKTLARMRSFAESQGLALQGTYHEIYLSDVFHTPPDQVEIILRLPVK